MVNDPKPYEIVDDEDGTEFGWGPGIFPPGIANGEGQSVEQDDFGVNVAGAHSGIGSSMDNYARAVADRRTDPTDPESGRDFDAMGLVDRYGPQPPLVRADPQRNISQRREIEQNKSERRW
jgi:hypothetical protein